MKARNSEILEAKLQRVKTHTYNVPKHIITNFPKTSNKEET